MKCPICKKTISDTALKCPFCNSRTGLLCKNCNTVNSVFDFVCKNCGKEILKLCPDCKSVNLPDSIKCRKCGCKFDKVNEDVNQTKLIYSPKLVNQKNAKNILVKGISLPDKKIFSLSGEKGTGKTLVLKAVMHEIKDYSKLYGKCTPLTQLTCGGVIQDMLLNLFELPNFCLNNLQFKKDASKYFQNEFPQLNAAEISDLINFLYPSKDGTFEMTVSAKTKTYDFLNKIFDVITADKKFIFIIDNFDFIDGFSYEFLSRYIVRKNVWENLKLLLLYEETKPAKGYFNNEKNENIYLDIGLAPLEFEQIYTILKSKKFKEYPEFDKHQLREIFKLAQGNPSFISNALDLNFDCQLSGIDFELPTTLKGIFQFRLSLLAHINPAAYDVLIGAALIGDKINMNLVREIFEIKEFDFTDILVYLKKSGYIVPVNDIYCEFSSLTLWETVIETAKDDVNYKQINERIFSYLSEFTLNSNAVMAILAQNLKNANLALNIWTKTTRLAAYTGDINLYAIAQKQCLALINEFDENETLKIRYNICERLGKLLANSNPKEAMEYLPDAVSNAAAIGDSSKEIELLSYLSLCCRKTGNYYGEVECVDSVLQKVSPENILDTALLKTTKLNALLNIGNCGQIINMIDNEIMPVLDQFFAKKQNQNDLRYPFIYDTWLRTYLVLANALVLQGNDRSFEILAILFDIIDRSRLQDSLFICKCKLTLAFANTAKGNLNDSKQMLDEVLTLYRENVMDNESILRWNLINIINNFISKNYTGMHEDLFQIVTFANNNGDSFTKNILKVLLGKIYKDNENSKQALEIYNDQITYFAKEKMAFGALLTWYLISDATLDTQGPEIAMEIAYQALEVAQNPKINNFYFIILLKMVIIKCTLVTSDFDTACMQLNQAISIAKKFNLMDLLSRLYLLNSRYFFELALSKTGNQLQYLQNAVKMNDMAEKIIKFTKNKYVYSDLQKSKKAILSYCRINSIKL